MDKNKIKSFAVWARRNLISAVSVRAKRIGITENKIENAVSVQGGFKLEGNEEIFKLSIAHRDALVNQIKEKGYQQVMEEVAYTWFNRFMGIRYMEVNGYIPSGIRVLSSETEGKKEPDVLSRVAEVIDELKLDAEKIYGLLDSGKTEEREEAYKDILVKQCNELGNIIPQMFEKISDYTELLLPDNLLEEDSVIRRIAEDIEEADWKEEVEIIGWMYQYYISEKKDEVFAALKKNVKITKENIPAATQLFTPKWIVKYMVENSLGRLWLEGHPNEELQKQWKYYLDEAEQDPEVEEELKKIREEHSRLKPEDIKVLDPCMGSGHILVYAFDVLYEIYKTAGYSEREIPRLILQNNLFGLDIDDRAAQLASFALIMKARHYNRRLFREIAKEHLELNLCSIQESNEIPKEAIDYFTGEDEDLKKGVDYLIEVFNDAKEYGSILKVNKIDFDAIEERLEEIKAFEQTDNEGDIKFPIEIPLQIDIYTNENRNIVLKEIPKLIKQAKIITNVYEICCVNPPYMSIRGADNKLSKYLFNNYNKYKSDLFAAFIIRSLNYIKQNGYAAMITMQSWLFLSSFEEVRKSIINYNTVNSLIQIGYNSFPSLNSQVAHAASFVIQRKVLCNYNGIYFNLNNGSTSADKNKVFLDKIKNKELYVNKINEFKSFPLSSFAYYASDKIKKIFKYNKKFSEIAEVKQGMTTSDNNRFLREWYEVYYNKIGFYYRCCEETSSGEHKWFPYNKGGDMRKWYGNNEFVVNYEFNGKEMKIFHEYLSKTSPGGRIKNQEYYFKKGLTWSKISTDGFTVRYVTKGFIFDVGGSSIFNIDEFYQLGFLNSKVAKILLNYISPTINYEAIHINSIPICDVSNKEVVYKLVQKNICISKKEWDNFETSWDFKIHPLLKSLNRVEQCKLSTIFKTWKFESEEAFNQLKSNEEELNKIFIEIYGLQDELTPHVEDKDITIRKADRERDIKSFISYAVGCMLGRYSIDAEGLIYAGGDLNDKWNLEDKKVRKIEKDEDGKSTFDSWVDSSFLPDGDNILPITENEYFEDDIVSRFIDFIRIVYGNDTLDENLDFIADSIGRKPSETARQAIRRYFIKDFYKDHLKVYQKRPIYWMFESGKNDGFKALIYMHRYNEQTVAKVRTDYLHTLQRKYEAEIQRQQLIADSEEYSAKDRTAARKKIERIAKQIEECREYDQVVAHIANDKISIDLDDGVKVNYEKFQGVKVINSKGKEIKMDLLAKI